MNNYNKLQILFHDIVFKKKFINKFLYDIEKLIYLNKLKNNIDSSIFITGLSRSGTTSLLNFIYSSNEFASLTYRNMPFVLTPHFSKLFNKKNISKRERLHKDRINFDINSPESFDEIFFNNDDDFIINELRNYIRLIINSEFKTRYLSKNNLNFKRIDLISSILPESIFLISIRDPLQHAFSLLKQHLNFCKLQRDDDFIRRYMNYIGHNEFGLNHIPLNKPIRYNDFNHINYWLEQWLFFYENIYNNYQSYQNCHFVIYERLDNLRYITKLLENLDLNKNKNLKLNYFQISTNKKIESQYDNNIYRKTKLVYENFLKLNR
tara:strand:- start:803 stop:1768 length:966 start_codon:yes stop_codon:yes gene_type:complete